jgi:pimeloyl-ACP methyl ester carboxylesterase
MVEVWREASGLSEAAARLICRRAARQRDQHFVWRSDPALNWVSSLIMTEEQVLDLLQHIECPALTYQVTPESPWISREKVAGRKSALTRGEHLTIRGHHHFHMDEPTAIAETIQSFILRHDQPTRPDTDHE